MSAIGACAPAVEAVARTAGAAAATTERGAQAVTTDLPPRLRTEIAAEIAGIATAQAISTRATTAAEGEGTAQGLVEFHSQVVAVMVCQAEGSRTNPDYHRAHLIRVLLHHHSQGLDRGHSP